jgi:hypothetical protein
MEEPLIRKNPLGQGPEGVDLPTVLIATSEEAC